MADEATVSVLQAVSRMAAIPSERAAAYALYEEYYSGFERTRDSGGSGKPRLTDRAKRYLERSGLPFCENFCETIVDVYAERLVVEGFSAEDKGEDATPAQEQAQTDDLVSLEDWLDSVWAKNRMDDQQGTVHTTAIEKGDAYVIVDWDEQRKLPRISFNRPELICHCVYNEEHADSIEWVSKLWRTDTVSFANPDGKPIERLNVYYPDRVEKWFRVTSGGAGGEGGWAAFYEVEGDFWPVPWTRSDGSPRGVPVFHFRHKRLSDEHGRSELRSVIPFQDELNKHVVDLNDIMDYLAWPQRYATGVSKDSASVNPQPGELLHSESSEAAFGQLDSADPTGALAVIEGTLSRLARRSRTPMHLLTGGTPPSGEALKTAESGLVSKVKKCQVPFGNVWEDVMGMALKLAADYGALPVSVDEQNLVLQTAWADPETRNDLQAAQEAELLDGIGVSKHTIFARLGLNYAEELEWKAKEKASLDEAAGRLLDAGAALEGDASIAPVATAEASGNGAGVGASSYAG